MSLVVLNIREFWKLTYKFPNMFYNNPPCKEFGFTYKTMMQVMYNFTPSSSLTYTNLICDTMTFEAIFLSTWKAYQI
jgi:hypothetical protein